MKKAKILKSFGSISVMDKILSVDIHSTLQVLKLDMFSLFYLLNVLAPAISNSKRVILSS